MDPKVASDMARVILHSDCREMLPRVTAKSLILACERDPVVAPSASRYVHEQIAGSELITLNARGHFPHLSDPRATVMAISGFLRDLPPGVTTVPVSARTMQAREMVRQGTQILSIIQGSEVEPGRDGIERDEVLDSLLFRVGELWMHVGRYDMYALSLQELLISRFGGRSTHFTVRTRGNDIARMMTALPRELSEHFNETRVKLESVLDRHEIAAKRGALIPGLASYLSAKRYKPRYNGREWFDQANASTGEWLEHLETVERDILKVVSLCFRVAHCAIGVQRVLRMPE
jgi:hypothetical protein